MKNIKKTEYGNYFLRNRINNLETIIYNLITDILDIMEQNYLIRTVGNKEYLYDDGLSCYESLINNLIKLKLVKLQKNGKYCLNRKKLDNLNKT